MMEDEISLRDLYQVLKKSSKFIVGFTLFAAVSVFVISFLLPKKYMSEAIVQAIVSPPTATSPGPSGVDTQGASSLSAIFKAMPTGQSFSYGFNKQIETKGPYVERVLGKAEVKVKSNFDSKKNLLTIRAIGGSAREAQQFVALLLNAFDTYVKNSVYEHAKTNLAGALAQARVSLDSINSQIKQLNNAFNNTPAAKADRDSQLALEASGTAVNVAGSDNPALAYLSLQIAGKKARQAELNSYINLLVKMSDNPEELRRLSEQVAQVNVLSPPALPDRPVSPRILLNSAIAAILALMMAVFWTFLRAAVSAEEPSAAPSPASPPEPGEAAELPR